MSRKKNKYKNKNADNAEEKKATLNEENSLEKTEEEDRLQAVEDDEEGLAAEDPAAGDKDNDEEKPDIISLEDEREAEGDEGEKPFDKVAELEKERDEYLDLCQRTRAEFENFRKRVSREKENDKILVRAELLKELLTPVDDLDRALCEAEKTPDFDTLFTGLKIVRDHLWKGLKTTGFEKIEAESGTDFNPNFHEAMMQIPHPEIPANKIVEEFAAGYRIGEFVLRPSKVGVSAGALEGEAEKAEENN